MIADCQSWEEVNKEIDTFIENCNKNNPANKQFTSYYKRMWEENGRTKIDVGSWSEFFYWENILSKE